jgi:hypothetical protein
MIIRSRMTRIMKKCMIFGMIKIFMKCYVLNYNQSTLNKELL